jgi:hypothetical protein
MLAVALLASGCASVPQSVVGSLQRKVMTVAAASPWPSYCVQSISVGQTVSGQFTTDDCSWYFSITPQHPYYTDVYAFSGTAGQKISISLSSSTVDTYVELYNVNDINATALVGDDDGGGGTNSRIPAGSGYYTLPATGTYYIWAYTADPGWTGAYALTLAAPAPAVPTVGQATVTEFHHPQFNHYFITAYPEEAAHLAAGNLPPWTPTGATFKVWNAPAAGLANVCRFFSGTFAPKSSHFYSHNPAECPSLAAGGVWALESSTAFYMMPTATGVCPAGTMPLYRLYNNGMSGAPNHRYTIHTSVRASMIAAGWVPEGNGVEGVFACVPYVDTPPPPPPPPPPASAFEAEVTGYVDTILGLASGDIANLDQLTLILGSAVEALTTPTTTCPVATSTPPLQGLQTFPPNLTINVSYGSGCTVSDGGTSATVSGSAVLSVSNLVFSDTAISGSLSLTFADVAVNGVPVADGSVQAVLAITMDPTTEAIAGRVTITMSNLTLPNGLGFSGSITINLNSAGSTLVSTNLTSAPHAIPIRLNVSIAAQPSGGVLVNTTSASTVGAYTVVVSNVKIDADVCSRGAIGGSISFSKGGQTGTLTFNNACSYTYSGP